MIAPNHTQPAPNWRKEAEVFYAAGLRVVPFWVNDSGGLGLPHDWRQYCTCDIEVLRGDAFWGKYGVNTAGLALLMTDDLEAIDVDTKADPTGQIRTEYIKAVIDCGGEEALSKCVCIHTKSQGMHFVYRAPNREGNKKLAARAGEIDGRVRPETLVETRGEGGLLFVAPTPGYRMANAHYTQAQTLTPEERNILIQAGRMCDRMPDQQPDKVREVREAQRQLPKGDGVTPWDAFNESTDVLDMMTTMGWTVVNQSGEYIRMNRPDSKNGSKIDGSVITSRNLFYPFSTSTEFEADRAYSPFAVYATTVHGGNFSLAAKNLYADGFGDRRGDVGSQKLDGSPASLDAAVKSILEDTGAGKPATAADELRQLLEEVDNDHTFDINKPLEDMKPVMWYVDPDTGKETGICALGMFGLMTGLQKSGKTTMLSAFVVAALTGEPYLNFRFDLRGRSILWIDCEQPKYWFQLVCARIYRLAGLKDNSPLFRAVNLRRYSKAQRAAICGALILREKELGLAIIDGLVDVCMDFMDSKSSEATVDLVLKWSDMAKAVIFGVIHLTKDGGYIKGQLGTIAQNKCDFALSSSKTEVQGAFRVTHREARGEPIPDFEFYRDDNGDPVDSRAFEKKALGQVAEMKAELREQEATEKRRSNTAYQKMTLVRAEEEHVPF